MTTILATSTPMTVNANTGFRTKFLLTINPFTTLTGIVVTDENPVAANRYRFAIDQFGTQTTTESPHRVLVMMTTTRPGIAAPATSGTIRVVVNTTVNGASASDDRGSIPVNFVTVQNPAVLAGAAATQDLVYGAGAAGQQELMIRVGGVSNVLDATFDASVQGWTFIEGAQTLDGFWLALRYTPVAAAVTPPLAELLLPGITVTINPEGITAYPTPRLLIAYTES